MPIFGDYTTVGEPVAVVEERGHVSTIWQARLTDASDGRLYAIKAYSPRRRSSKSGLTDAALEHDRRLEFITGIKELKKTQSEKAGPLAAVHGFGIAAEGAWYAMDFHPRSLKTWINLRVRADSAALEHLVANVVAGCLALKRSRGFSHGNLKTSNIFLAGKPRPLRNTPLYISDPYPASSAQLAELDASDREAVGELLGQTMEVQDLRAIGELLLQLVEGRLIANSYDYNYPVARSPAWDQLGREGEVWRERCNRLLDPQLSLEKINLEILEKEFRPSAAAGKLLVVVGGVAAVCLIGGGLFYGVSVHNKRKAREFQNTVQAAADALERTNLAVAKQQIEQALEQRPTDAKALGLKDQIVHALDSRYTSALESAQAQLRDGNLVAALELAKQALDYKPADAGATGVISAIEREKKFQTTMNEARAAFDGSNYDRAVELAEQAVGIKPDDAKAIALREQARSKAENIRRLAKQKEDYQNEISQARSASASGDYSNELAHAEIALGIQPNDREARTLESEAQKGLGETITRTQIKEKFQQTMADAKKAFDQANYTNAVRLADQALGIVPKDASATKLREDATSRLALIHDDADKNQKYKAAMESARAAMRTNGYASAITFCDQALGIKGGDDEAVKLRRKAQTALDEIRIAREIDQKYQDAMKQARASFEHLDYTNALLFARQALVTRSNDANATKIQADAQAKLDDAKAAQELDRKYQTAMRDGQAAFNRGKYDVAEKQANAALALDKRNNDAKAMSLKQQATDIQLAQNSFTNGEYEAASAICARYRGIDAFDALNLKVKVPKEALDDANRRNIAGDYSFIENLEKTDYAKVAAFSNLLARAKSERQTLNGLEALTNNPANWTNVNDLLLKVDGSAMTNAPFQRLKTWRDQNDPKIRREREVKDLDAKLEGLLACVGKSKSASKEILDPVTHGRAKVLDTGTPTSDYYRLRDQLEAEYKARGLLPSRQKDLNTVEAGLNLLNR
jgi:tetratricopeptide (TPR) repeat protein